ncbi:MAG: hypothetical protein JW828_10195 [Sedimentisphaerales bacterium]|nr:hypothetical protein [Sedimentisphaerales bacterium]
MTPWLEQELTDLGYALRLTHDTGVEIEGGLNDVMRLNLHLRTANNVMLLIKSFPCRSPQQLYEEVYNFGWEQIVDKNGYISVVSRVDTPSINNTMFANLKVKDAIVDRLLEKTGTRPDSGKERIGLLFHLYWKQDKAWLYLNTSGQKLSDRGYRKMPHSAPMRESLAAAVLLATKYDGSVPLVNPMCGSGTLAIEAALIATHKAPGLLRSRYAFLEMKEYDAALWKSMRTEALNDSRRYAKTHKPRPIVATDRDPKAIQAARKNAQTAGVESWIEFHVCDFADTAIPEEPGIILMNPEYGQRLGQIRALEETYGRIGDFFKQRCGGWKGSIFTGNLDLAKKVGLRTKRRIPFFNADIECRLLEYEMYAGSRKAPPAGG